MKKTLILSGAAVLGLMSCKTAKNADGEHYDKSYRIYSKSGTQVQGTAKFNEAKGKVEMDLMVYKLSPGLHAVHIHEKGDCSATDASSAGGHWNPGGDAHGKWESDAFHMGDIGNIKADANGSVRYIFETDKWCLGCKDEKKNIIGKSLVIHEKPDDFHTQPTGNAGDRVGCVEIK